MTLMSYPTCSEPGRLTDDVICQVMAAHAFPGAWRSDSGDPSTDLEWESRRWDLLTPAHQNASDDLKRRCFLFSSLFGESRAAH